jgi:hypothetical protein
LTHLVPVGDGSRPPVSHPEKPPGEFVIFPMEKTALSNLKNTIGARAVSS